MFFFRKTSFSNKFSTYLRELSSAAYILTLGGHNPLLMTPAMMLLPLVLAFGEFTRNVLSGEFTRDNHECRNGSVRTSMRFCLLFFLCSFVREV